MNFFILFPYYIRLGVMNITLLKTVCRNVFNAVLRLGQARSLPLHLGLKEFLCFRVMFLKIVSPSKVYPNLTSVDPSPCYSPIVCSSTLSPVHRI